MNEWLKYNIDNYVLKAIEKKHDAIILVTGIEGSGKSTLATTMAHYCDPNNFNIDHVVFDPIELMKRIDSAHVGASIVFDEAILGLSSQDFSTQIQKILIKKFVTIRKKRLIIFLVLPSIFLLRKYFAVFRTRLLIHAYCPDGITRGQFRFFSYYKKRKLYIYGYKEMNMNAVKADFIGGFTNTMGHFFDLNEYDAKKEKAIKKLNQGKDPVHIEREKYLEKAKELRERYDKSIKLWREKFREQKKEFATKYKELSKDNNKEILKKVTAKAEEFKEKLLVERTKITNRYKQQIIDYKKLLVYLYEREKILYKEKTGKDLSLELFHQQLFDLNLYTDDFDTIKKNFSAGKKEIKKIKKLTEND